MFPVFPAHVILPEKEYVPRFIRLFVKHRYVLRQVRILHAPLCVRHHGQAFYEPDGAWFRQGYTVVLLIGPVHEKPGCRPAVDHRDEDVGAASYGVAGVIREPGHKEEGDVGRGIDCCVFGHLWIISCITSGNSVGGRMV